MSEASLIKRLLARDESAFLELVDEHHGGLLRLVQSFVRSPAVADDVVQETWRAFIEALETFEQRASVKTFLYRIAANLARTRAVRDARTTPMSALDGDGDASSPLAERFSATGNWLAPPSAWAVESADVIVGHRQALQALAHAMESLPERQRAVVQMRDIEGLPAEEVCELLGVSDVHQRVLLHRARTTLRAVLEAHLSG